MERSALLPLPQGLRITDVCQEETSLLITVLSERTSACCLLCRCVSDAVHSRYHRRLKDVPCGGKAICLQLTVHKFFCHNPECSRRVFTERFPTFVEPWAQMTLRLSAALQAIGFSTSGSLGARLAARLGIVTSWMTILRRMMALPVPPPGAVTALDIDDFSFKRGRKFGTILVNLVRHVVIDLLAERSSQSAADWMRKHPEIDYVSRDRGKDYAQGASDGAPQAVQVSDRFHLMKNFVEAVEAEVSRCYKQLRQMSGRKSLQEKRSGNDLNVCPTRASALNRSKPSFHMGFLHRRSPIYSLCKCERSISGKSERTALHISSGRRSQPRGRSDTRWLRLCEHMIFPTKRSRGAWL